MSAEQDEIRRLAIILKPSREGLSELRLREGVVTATSPLTITVGASAVAIPNVRRLSSYSAPAVDDVVMILQAGADLLVLGPVV